MREEIIQCDDYVLGLANQDVTYPNPINRHERVVRSMLLAELVAAWQNDCLKLKDMLEKVDDLDMYDWETTMRWLGQFYAWKSCRGMCDLVREYLEMEEED